MARRRRSAWSPTSGTRCAGTWITQPTTYLLILLVLAITLVPMLYLILSGFRTTGQLGSNPNGLPHPWVWTNYATILTSAVFWQAVQNNAIIAVVATTLSRRRAGRRDQGLSTTQRDEPGHGHPAAGRGTVRFPGRDRYRPAPLGTRCGAPKAASRRSCWSSV